VKIKNEYDAFVFGGFHLIHQGERLYGQLPKVFSIKSCSNETGKEKSAFPKNSKKTTEHVNEDSQEISLRYTPGSVEKHSLFDLDNGQWDNPALRQLLEKVLPTNERFHDFPVEHTFPRVGKRKLLLNARRLIRATGETALILLAMEDITTREERGS
jgi:hypothetical protein